MDLFMEQFVGLDVSQKLTHVCVVDQKGSVVWRGTCLSTPEDIAATVRAKAPHAERIGRGWPKGPAAKPLERTDEGGDGSAVDLALERLEDDGAAGDLHRCPACQSRAQHADQQDRQERC